MTSCFAEIDWEQEVRAVAANQSSFMPTALTPAANRRLLADSARLNWTPQANDHEPWLRYSDAKVTSGWGAYPGIAAVRQELQSQLWSFAHLFPSLAGLDFNDVTAQRYEDEEDGIDTHQDYSVDKLIIAIVTAAGRGPLDIMSARHNGKPVMSYDTVPGSLALLWAPGLTDTTEDLRPPHRILLPYGPRISVTFRCTTGTVTYRNQTLRRS